MQLAEITRSEHRFIEAEKTISEVKDQYEKKVHELNQKNSGLNDAFKKAQSVFKERKQEVDLQLKETLNISKKERQEFTNRLTNLNFEKQKILEELTLRNEQTKKQSGRIENLERAYRKVVQVNQSIQKVFSKLESTSERSQQILKEKLHKAGLENRLLKHRCKELDSKLRNLNTWTKAQINTLKRELENLPDGHPYSSKTERSITALLRQERLLNEVVETLETSH